MEELENVEWLVSVCVQPHAVGTNNKDDNHGTMDIGGHFHGPFVSRFSQS